MIKEIVSNDNPFLRKRSGMLLEKDFKLVLEIAEDLSDTLNTVGNYFSLSAVQIGIPKRMFIIKMEGDKDPHFYVNPEIVKKSKKKDEYMENVIGFSGYKRKSRYKYIDVIYRDKFGREKRERLRGYKSALFQKEYDIINGKID